jgi:hypothetical protein
MTESLKEKLTHLEPDGGVVLLQVSLEKAVAVNIDTLQALQSLGWEGVYVLLSHDYLELSQSLAKGGVDLSRLSFVEGVSQMYGIKQEENPRLRYVPSPLALSELSKAIVSLAPDKKFVFLDSVTVILLYNALERTLEFCRSLAASLKKLKVLLIIESISLDETLLQELKELSNEVIQC